MANPHSAHRSVTSTAVPERETATAQVGAFRTWRRFRLVTMPPELLVALAAIWFVVVSDSRFWDLFLTGRTLTSWHTLGLITTMALTLAAGHFVFIVPFSSRWVLKPVLTFHLIGSSIALYFMNHLHVYLDPSMLQNVLETDAAEASEVLQGPLLAYIVVFGLLPSILVWLVRFPPEKLWPSLRRRLLTAGLALVVLTSTLAIGYDDYASYFTEHHSNRHLIAPENYAINAIRALYSSTRVSIRPRTVVGEDASLGPQWIAGTRPVLFVLVVGETARAANFSLGGYERDTNPELRAERVTYFSRVTSCGTSTARSLPCMFSPLTRTAFKPSRDRHSEGLLDVLGHAGLEVHWISNNSGCKGVCDGIGRESVEDDETNELCNHGDCFDEVLIDHTMALAEQRANDLVVVLHQKGSHGPAYFRRYPPRFARYQPECRFDDLSQCSREEIQNSYDNSILYTDFVLAELIHTLAAMCDRDTAMLFVSDHGESLGESGFFLHGLPYALAPDVQTHVPMVFWMSDGFAARFEIDRARLAAAAPQPWSHDNLFHSVLGLLDVRTAVYDPDLDLFRDTRLSAARSAQLAARAPTLKRGP